MINKTVSPFCTLIPSSEIASSMSETNVSIKNEADGEVKIIKMQTHTDGRVEIEMHEGEEIPFHL